MARALSLGGAAPRIRGARALSLTRAFPSRPSRRHVLPSHVDHLGLFGLCPAPTPQRKELVDTIFAVIARADAAAAQEATTAMVVG